MAGESGRALKEVGVVMGVFYLFRGRFRRDRIVLLVGDRAVGRVVAQHFVARAAHGAAEHQALAFVFDEHVGELPFGAARLVSADKHD
jgi:hypothetical protein